MEPNLNKKIINLSDSSLGCLLTLVILSLILGAVGLQWIVNGFLILVALVLFTPLVALLIFRWWLKRNMIESSCPVCDYTFTAFNNTNCRCPSCGESLTVELTRFVRETPPDIIEVSAVDISEEN